MTPDCRISWMWIPNDRVIAVRVTDLTGVVEMVLRSQPLAYDEPIRRVVEILLDTLESIGYSHGDDRATVLGSAKVGFEALALRWDEDEPGARVLQ